MIPCQCIKCMTKGDVRPRLMRWSHLVLIQWLPRWPNSINSNSCNIFEMRQLYILEITLNLLPCFFIPICMSLDYFYLGGIICDCSLVCNHLRSYCRCLNTFFSRNKVSSTSTIISLHPNLQSKRVEICLRKHKLTQHLLSTWSLQKWDQQARYRTCYEDQQLKVFFSNYYDRIS